MRIVAYNLNVDSDSRLAFPLEMIMLDGIVHP